MTENPSAERPTSNVGHFSEPSNRTPLVELDTVGIHAPAAIALLPILPDAHASALHKGSELSARDHVKLSLRVDDERGRQAIFQPEKRRAGGSRWSGFVQPSTLKLLRGNVYRLRCELMDLGGTVVAIDSLVLDEQTVQLRDGYVGMVREEYERDPRARSLAEIAEIQASIASLKAELMPQSEQVDDESMPEVGGRPADGSRTADAIDGSCSACGVLDGGDTEAGASGGSGTDNLASSPTLCERAIPDSSSTPASAEGAEVEHPVFRWRCAWAPREMGRPTPERTREMLWVRVRYYRGAECMPRTLAMPIQVRVAR